MTEFWRVDNARGRSPFGHVVVHLLDECNLACHHCYLNASRHGRNALSLPLVLGVLDDAQALGIRSIQLSGGEPLLHPDFGRILAACGGREQHVTVSTNATLMDDATAALMAEVGADAVVSIDGPEPYHDAFRAKKGCFRQAEAGVRRLVSHRVPVKIVTTLCQDNVEQLQWCAEWALAARVDALQFQPLESFGRGRKLERKKLSDEALHRLFIRTSDLSVAYASRGLRIGLSYQSRDRLLAHPCLAYVCNGKRCHRGVAREIKRLVIRENGLIFPELMDMDPRFSFGNLHDRSLYQNLATSFDEKYALFDALCRTVFIATVPGYPSPLIPWNEILAERSWGFADDHDGFQAQCQGS